MNTRIFVFWWTELTEVPGTSLSSFTLVQGDSAEWSSWNFPNGFTNKKFKLLFLLRSCATKHLTYLIWAWSCAIKHLIYLVWAGSCAINHGGLQADLKGGSAAPPGNKSLNLFKAVQTLPGRLQGCKDCRIALRSLLAGQTSVFLSFPLLFQN